MGHRREHRGIRRLPVVTTGAGATHIAAAGSSVHPSSGQPCCRAQRQRRLPRSSHQGALMSTPIGALDNDRSRGLDARARPDASERSKGTSVETHRLELRADAAGRRQLAFHGCARSSSTAAPSTPSRMRRRNWTDGSSTTTTTGLTRESGWSPPPSGSGSPRPSRREVVGGGACQCSSPGGSGRGVDGGLDDSGDGVRSGHE
jgi:hypothetical protein